MIAATPGVLSSHSSIFSRQLGRSALPSFKALLLPSFKNQFENKYIQISSKTAKSALEI
jgi:hypothetical protein